MPPLALPRQLTRRGSRADAAMLRRLIAIAFLLLCVADAIPLVPAAEMSFDGRREAIHEQAE